MVFDYAVERTFLQSIDVVDPGNMALRCLSDDGGEYYLIVRSIMGMLNFLEFGPVLEGVQTFFGSYSTVTYKQAKYSEKALMKEVKSFINDPQKKITEVTEILPEEAIELLPDVKECWANI